jgi:glutamine amidotransferase
VGSFDTGMRKLQASGMKDALMHHAKVLKKPLLGICLGMQMLGLKSEEGILEGLGLIPFETVKFQLDPSLNLKTPHMGWNLVQVAKDDGILKGIQTHPRYYFVHSYHAKCQDEKDVLMWCEYGYTFAASVKKDNVYGFQFHPEKSHHFGMTLLANFASEVH